MHCYIRYYIIITQNGNSYLIGNYVGMLTASSVSMLLANSVTMLSITQGQMLLERGMPTPSPVGVVIVTCGCGHSDLWVWS